MFQSLGNYTRILKSTASKLLEPFQRVVVAERRQANSSQSTARTVPKVSTKPAQDSCVGYYCINKEQDTLITLRPHQQKALEKLTKHQRGQVIVPTGGGKTLVAIMDALRLLEASTEPQTIVVVAPRILLSQQLQKEFMEVISDSIANVIPAQVNSGETNTFHTTKPEKIRLYNEMCKNSGLHSIIFTTYQSLARVAEAQLSC